MNINKAVDKKFETMSLREILKAPVDAIQGISEKDGELMKEAFRISTVEQFSKLRFAKWAFAINELAKTQESGGDDGGLNIDNAVDKAYENKTIKQILGSPVECLQGISERQAGLLKEAFGIDTVKELAENKYIGIARAIYFLALSEDPNSDPNSKL